MLSRTPGAMPAVARIFDGEKEAKLIALACSKPPKGRARWTLRLLENKVVELGIVDRASDSTIGRALKKTLFSPILQNMEAGSIWPSPSSAVLPHKLKEMCRIKISVAHQCGYCSTVRSNVAKAEGLTEDMIIDLASAYRTSKYFTAREKAALHYAELFKQGEHAIDRDEVYDELKQHFSDEEIIELGLLCGMTDGVGKLVKSFDVLSWEDACELRGNPQ